MFIFSNLAITLDGKIATSKRGFLPLGTSYDRKQMERLRQMADAILIGASTLRSLPDQDFRAKKGKNPAIVILSSNLEGLSSSTNFFKDSKLRKILLVGPKATQVRIKKFSKSCEIYQLKTGSVAPQIVRHLASLKIKNLLVEGGGTVMWEFVRKNLIDRYYVTLTPKILGGFDSPTLVDGKGFQTKEILQLKLEGCKKVGDEIYLTYAKRT